MLVKLGLENFKAWRGRQTLDLKPLTLVLGVNSAGKTSLLQPLLLLKQTVESPDRLQALNFGGQQGELLDLGNLLQVVSGHDPTATLALRLTFGPVALGHAREGQANVVRGSGTNQPRRSAKEDSADDDEPTNFVDFEVDYEATEDGAPHVQRVSYFTERGVYGAARLPDGKYQLNAPHHSPLPGDDGADRFYEPERSVGFSAEAIAALGSDGPVAQDLALALTQELQRIAYLGPVRVRPQRFYAWTGQTPGQLGASGELAIPALIANLVRGGRDGTDKGQLVTKVSDWLRRLDLVDSVDLERDGSHYRVDVTIQGLTSNLVDVGFGVSQVLPVVTLALFAEPGSLVILEQPELHLHPLAQAELADLLVEASRERKVRFLVETHSEHLFRRLQTLMAGERLSPDDCSMFFVRRQDGNSLLDRLKVNAYGRVTNWPEKFFGDTTGEVERQAERMLDRMERDERGG